MRCHFLRIVLAASLLTCGLTGCGDGKKDGGAPKAPADAPKISSDAPAKKISTKSE